MRSPMKDHGEFCLMEEVGARLFYVEENFIHDTRKRSESPKVFEL